MAGPTCDPLRAGGGAVLDPACSTHGIPRNVDRNDFPNGTRVLRAPARKGPRLDGRAAVLQAVRPWLTVFLSPGSASSTAPIERGELSGRCSADLGAEVVKVEPPGGSPARHTRAGPLGVSLAFAVRNAGQARRGARPRRPTPTVERFHDLLAHADVLLTSEVGARRWARQRRATSRPATRTSSSCAITPFGLDGPYADWVATDALLSATGGIAFKAGVPERHAVVPARPSRRRRSSRSRARSPRCARSTSASRPVPGSSSSCRRTRRWRTDRRLGAARTRARASRRATPPARCATGSGRSIRCSSARAATCG